MSKPQLKLTLEYHSDFVILLTSLPCN